jgi:hypothetical protein
MDALADPSHPDHAEHSEWVAETTGSDEPLGRLIDPASIEVTGGRAMSVTPGVPRSSEVDLQPGPIRLAVSALAYA